MPGGITTSTDALPVTSKPGSAAWTALSSGGVPSVVAPSLTATSVSLVSSGVGHRPARDVEGHVVTRRVGRRRTRPGSRRARRSACSRRLTVVSAACRTRPCSRPSPAGRSCRCPALPGAVDELRKLSPPEARNEFTVTEYVVAGTDRRAVEPHPGDAASRLAACRRRVGGVGEALRDAQLQERTRRARRAATAARATALICAPVRSMFTSCWRTAGPQRPACRSASAGRHQCPIPTMSVRRPPGFMNAICAEPASGLQVCPPLHLGDQVAQGRLARHGSRSCRWPGSRG